MLNSVLSCRYFRALLLHAACDGVLPQACWHQGHCCPLTPSLALPLPLALPPCHLPLPPCRPRPGGVSRRRGRRFLLLCGPDGGVQGPLLPAAGEAEGRGQRAGLLGPRSRPAPAAHRLPARPLTQQPTHPSTHPPTRPCLQDNSTVGIRATLARLSQAVRNHDEQLWEHLEAAKLNPQFYAFR